MRTGQLTSVRVVLDSLHADHPTDERMRLTTFLCTYPRLIHSEIMTHRAFSRNAASSRAIPFKKQASEVLRWAARPAAWGTNQPGMQAGESLDEWQTKLAEQTWEIAAQSAVEHAFNLNDQGLHKQVVNRVIEPYTFMTTVISSTRDGLANFFALRSHPDADPTLQALSDVMLHAYMQSQPVVRAVHQPFVTQEEQGILFTEECNILSVARCARTSYVSMDKVVAFDDDRALYTKLLQNGHWSPFEHVAYASNLDRPGGNFYRWLQLRHTFHDTRPQTDLQALYLQRMGAPSDAIEPGVRPQLPAGSEDRESAG